MPSERCVGARRLRATGDPLEFVQTTDPLRLTLFKSARIRAAVYQDAEREIYWVGVRLLGQERFSQQSRGVREIWCLDNPALVPERL